MKIVAMIPYWNEYVFPDQSIGSRDTLKVGGHSLIEHAVRVVQNIEQIDDVIIYSSDSQVMELLDDLYKCKFQERDTELDSVNISIEDIIESFLGTSDAEIIVLLHPKYPFLRSESIEECINRVVDGSHDSAFIGSQHRRLAWFEGKPLNYSLEKNGSTPSLSTLEPVITESSSVYVFTRTLFMNTRRRIGLKPFMKFLGHFEGFEIDRLDDYEIAELIVNAGLDIMGNEYDPD